MTAPDKASVLAAAEAYVTEERFHKKFVIPPSDGHDGLTFSYSDVGCVPDCESAAGSADTPVILFFPGVFATRYLGVTLHRPALALGVRILVVDRPGMGSSTNVPIEKRISTWVEILPKLLAHLNIPHVSIVSHCAGKAYALNTLYQCRDVLHPQRPQVVLLAPWVDPGHSRVAMMQIGQYVPNKAFNAWNSINRFVACNVMPSIASSQGMFGKSTPNAKAEQAAKSWRNVNAAQIARDFGESIEFQQAVLPVVIKRLFAEDTTGSNSEALFCLRKAPPGSWEKSEDDSKFVSDLAELERSRATQGRSPAEKLRVMAYFSNSDIMIGMYDDVLDYDSRIIPGPDHDGLVYSVDLLKLIVADIRGDGH